MGFIELILLAAGLSMDAFAVSICKGLGMKKFNFKHAVIIALFFGIFQAGMPLIGWLLGSQFEQFITPVDHWIAFGLLALLGVRMLIEAFRGEDDKDEEVEQGERLSLKELIMLAIATSIDALAVGITFAFLGVDIVFSVVAIGITTFVFSLAGVAIGNRFGAHFEKAANIAGGLVLTLIGVKILLEHMGVLVL